MKNWIYPSGIVFAFFLQLTPLQAGSDEQPTEEQRLMIQRNAALHYWKAIASQNTALSPEDAATLMFINQDFQGLPPSALEIRQDAARWMINETALIASLNQAASLPVCIFATEEPDSPRLRLTHLAPLRTLLLYGISISKAFEYVENTDGAAGLYTILLDMTLKLNQDRSPLSSRVGMNLLQDLLMGLEGFTLREPPLESLEILEFFFANNPEAPFSIAQGLADDAERIADWLRSSPETLLDRLSSLYGKNRAPSAAILLLSTLPVEEQMARVELWLDEYLTRINALHSLFEKPYLAGLAEINDYDRTRTELPDATVENPLLPLLLPAARDLYEREQLAKGHYTIMKILVSAARYRALIGKWPKNLDVLKTFTNRSFAPDPFSGQPIHYRLKNDLPRLVIRTPKQMAAANQVIYTIDLSVRKNQDQDAVHRLRQAATRQFIETRMSAKEKAKLESTSGK